MPLCVFQTNVPGASIPVGFENDLTQVLANVLNKPIEKITVVVQPEQIMARGGTNDPTCLLVLWSIAVFSVDKNPTYANKLYPFISEKLGITHDRIVILFNDIKQEQLAKPSSL